MICACFWIAIVLIIFIFIVIIFVSQITNLMYNLKTDMYLMNRAAIVAVNRNKGNVDVLSYDVNAYRDSFEDMLKVNYNLDFDFKNDGSIIEKIEILNYEIYKKKDEDSYSNVVCKNDVIHTVLRVKIKPIILKNFFDDFFVFEVHEDVVLNGVKM